MTTYTLDEIRDAFQGCNLYIATDEAWKTPEDLTKAQIVTDGYEGSTPYTRPVSPAVNESIISLMKSGDIEAIKLPTNIVGNQEDPLWKTKGYEGPALKLIPTR